MILGVVGTDLLLLLLQVLLKYVSALVGLVRSITKEESGVKLLLGLGLRALGLLSGGKGFRGFFMSSRYFLEMASAVF